MKIYYACLAIIASLFLTSCQITENIYLNEDGRGKIAYDIDASELMSMMGDKLGEAGKEDIDSTMTFKQLFEEKKDSIAKMSSEEQQRLKKFEDVSMHLQVNSVAKTFKMSLLNDFKKASDLQDMGEALKAMKSFDKKAETASNPLVSMMESGNNTELKYAFDGKVFKRTMRVIDSKLQQSKDSTGMMKMMFAGSQYVMKYHFPKKVKSVSNPNALYSDDRKTVTIPFSLADYMESPEKMSFEILLDKK